MGRGMVGGRRDPRKVGLERGLRGEKEGNKGKEEVRGRADGDR